MSHDVSATYDPRTNQTTVAITSHVPFEDPDVFVLKGNKSVTITKVTDTDVQLKIEEVKG